MRGKIDLLDLVTAEPVGRRNRLGQFRGPAHTEAAALHRAAARVVLQCRVEQQFGRNLARQRRQKIRAAAGAHRLARQGHGLIGEVVALRQRDADALTGLVRAKQTRGHAKRHLAGVGNPVCARINIVGKYLGEIEVSQSRIEYRHARLITHRHAQVHHARLERLVVVLAKVAGGALEYQPAVETETGHRAHKAVRCARHHLLQQVAG